MVTPLDWHKEDIKAAVRKTGATLRSLSIGAGYHPSAGNKTLNCHWPQMQAVIARHLGLRPQEIWPSRYLKSGAPVSGAWAKGKPKQPRRYREINERPAPPAEQKRRAA